MAVIGDSLRTHLVFFRMLLSDVERVHRFDSHARLFHSDAVAAEA